MQSYKNSFRFSFYYRIYYIHRFIFLCWDIVNMGCSKSKLIDLSVETTGYLLDLARSDAAKYSVEVMQMIYDKNQYRHSSQRRIDELAKIAKTLVVPDDKPALVRQNAGITEEKTT